MEQSILTRNDAPNKALATNSARVNDDTLQPGGTLDRQINNDNPHCPKPVTGSEVAYQLCQ